MKLMLLAFVFLGGVYFGLQADREGDLADLVGLIDRLIYDVSK
jgi:hypothetical protein